ncbi:acyltransferase family protein [Ktedonospora formicarum]|uniref:Acyltransferase n=1 Tax=Ktedonospora formicarum TaxID=2778364 RepID=A0A8J3I3B8_9CHLR|nr:acyltransferase [Ktedonospora formicarum]GHO45968.1 acyltransferase [Ktedonospora formicarum]
MSTLLGRMQSRFSRFHEVGDVDQQVKMNRKEIPQKKTIASLDGVRAIACFTVVGYHINLITRDTGIWDPKASSFGHAWMTALFLSGFSGVTLFFVLSGFLLFLPYARALLLKTPWPSLRLYCLRRALRIVPAYYITLALLLLFYDRSYLQLQHLGHIGLFLIFFMDSTKDTYQKVEGPFWTLAVEAQFYVLLPLLALGMRWLVHRLSIVGRGWVLIGCLCALMVWGVCIRAWGIESEQLSGQFYDAIQVIRMFLYGQTGKYLEDFAVGMLLSLCYVATQHPKGGYWAARLRQWSYCIGGIGLLALAGMMWWNTHFVFHFSPWEFLNTVSHTYPWVHEWLFACSYGACLVAILYGPNHLQRFFSWKPLRSLGNVSYSMYMWHFPLLMIFMIQVGYRLQNGNGLIIYGLYWLYAFLLIVPYSTLFYQLFEKPGIALSAKIGHRSRPLAEKIELPFSGEGEERTQKSKITVDV